MYRIIKKTLFYSLLSPFLFLFQNCKSDELNIKNESINNIDISKKFKADSTKFVDNLYNLHGINASKSFYLSKEQYNSISNDAELKKNVTNAIKDSILTISIIMYLKSYFKDNNKEKLFNSLKNFKEEYDRKDYQMDMYLVYEPNTKKQCHFKTFGNKEKLKYNDTKIVNDGNITYKMCNKVLKTNNFRKRIVVLTEKKLQKLNIVSMDYLNNTFEENSKKSHHNELFPYLFILEKTQDSTYNRYKVKWPYE